MGILTNIEDEMHRLVEGAAERDITLRVLGGLAVAEHCSHADHRALQREYPDIDFVTDKSGARHLEDFFAVMGYTPNKTLNTLSGDWRRLYYDEAHGRQVDVFIESFEMNHRLPLADRLDVEPVTIPLAELFLTKAQIVELNRKDVKDLCALLLDHEVGHSDEETINVEIIADLCSNDWGLCTTVSMNVDRLGQLLDREVVTLDREREHLVRERAAEIRQAVEESPKTLSWKLRDVVGTRVRWYEEVEEVRR